MVGICNKSFSQQNFQYTQYMYDLSIINPAFAGGYGALNVSLIHRDQWSNVPGAPQGQTLSAHTLFKSKQLGAGLIFHQETIGIHKNLQVGGNFAYHLRLNKSTNLSVGLHAGAFNTQSDYQSLQSGGFDPTAINDAYTGTQFNAGFGLYLKSESLELGYSVPTLLKREVYINDTINLDPTAVNHLFFSRYTIELNDRFKLAPSVLFKYLPNASFSYDINLMATYLDFISTGVSYRRKESIDLLLRFQITPQFEIGYAYDYPISNVGAFSRASNELLLRYLFKFRYNKVKSPR